VAAADDDGDDDAKDRCYRSDSRGGDQDDSAMPRQRFRFTPLRASLGRQDQLTLQPPPVVGICFDRHQHQPELLGQIQELLRRRDWAGPGGLSQAAADLSMRADRKSVSCFPRTHNILLPASLPGWPTTGH